MSKLPYPGFSPNFKIVGTINGLYRNCIVIELQSVDKLNNVQMAIIQEQLEATVNRLADNIIDIKNTDVVSDDRFDSILREGLRLPKHRD